MKWEKPKTVATALQNGHRSVPNQDGPDRILRMALVQICDLIRRGTHWSRFGLEAIDAFRAAVRSFASSYRRRGATPEETLIVLKRMIRELHPDFTDDRRIVDRNPLHVFADRTISWCIEDYYRDA